MAEWRSRLGYLEPIDRRSSRIFLRRNSKGVSVL
jgi:hypothetical protein